MSVLDVESGSPMKRDAHDGKWHSGFPGNFAHYTRRMPLEFPGDHHKEDRFLRCAGDRFVGLQVRRHAIINLARLERCQSGRLGLSRKQVGRQRSPGFESLPLRSYVYRDCFTSDH